MTLLTLLSVAAGWARCRSLSLSVGLAQGRAAGELQDWCQSASHRAL